MKTLKRIEKNGEISKSDIKVNNQDKLQLRKAAGLPQLQRIVAIYFKGQHKQISEQQSLIKQIFKANKKSIQKQKGSKLQYRELNTLLQERQLLWGGVDAIEDFEFEENGIQGGEGKQTHTVDKSGVGVEPF